MRAIAPMTLVLVLVACDSKPEPAPTPAPAAQVAAAVIDELVEAKIASATNTAQMLQRATEMYRMQKPDACPESTQALAAERMIARDEVDPWGNAFVIACTPDGSAEVTSLGPDGAKGTADDIVAKGE